MAYAVLRHWLCMFVLLLTFLALVHCDDSVTLYANLSDAIPQLQDLYNFPLTKAPWLGGQNFTYCCLKAVNASYQVVNGIVGQVADPQNRFIDLSVGDLNATQFPCGASYNGSDAGAPLVTITYPWCRDNCGGWEQSTNKVLTQWIQPFVGFILPAAVFCLNVPRKMVIRISDDLFRGRYDEISDIYYAIEFDREHILGATVGVIYLGAILFLVFIEIVLRGAWAASIALTDTVVWVSIVFSTAAPMILSGLYEATLDRMIIEKVQYNHLNYENSSRDPLYLKVHLLYAVLVGNLDLYHPSEISNDPDERYVWDDVRSLVAPFDLQSETLRSGEKDTTDILSTEIRDGTKIRLNGMLGCQASFGAAIGAPVVFFLGSFFFSTFSDLSTVGDNDTSHAQAFGMWWMTIPHVAIVAGCLLAGNNPNTLEVIVCGLSPWRTEAPESLAPARMSPTFIGKIKGWIDTTIKLTLFEQPKNREHFWHYLSLYRPFYDSVYQPVWMWERGRSKRNWVRRVEAEFTAMKDQEYRHKPRIRDFEDKTQEYYRNFEVGKLDWIYIIVITLVLMTTPFLLAFLTSFYTPTVGLSCRSFTFLLYFIFQFLLSLLWLWDFRFTKRSKMIEDIELPWGKVPVPTVFCIIMVIGLTGSAFTTVAGTFLQILGVYRNCLCTIPMSAWSSGNYNFVVSTNSADRIRLAEHFWLPTGIASIVALIIVCYIGWWYQRHWRRRFAVVIDEHLDIRKKPSLDPNHLQSKKQAKATVKALGEGDRTDSSDEIQRF